jgi:hypothetical protein
MASATSASSRRGAISRLPSNPRAEGTKLTWIGEWDNSADNPRNPDPNKEVRFGLQTWDEMMNGWMEVVKKYNHENTKEENTKKRERNNGARI